MLWASFADFIKTQGEQAVADAIPDDPNGKKIDINAVRVMRTRNYISRRHWPDLLLAVPELGLNDLIAMEAQSKGAAIRDDFLRKRKAKDVRGSEVAARDMEIASKAGE